MSDPHGAVILVVPIRIACLFDPLRHHVQFVSRVCLTLSATMSIACSSGMISHRVPYGRRYRTFRSR
jgi:hypothetical protein